MSNALIYRPARNAMQSGKAKTNNWLLEFSPEQVKSPDDLMGWSGSGDMNSQIRMKFPSQEEAEAYCKREKIDYVVCADNKPRVHLKSYADLFK